MRRLPKCRRGLLYWCLHTALIPPCPPIVKPIRTPISGRTREKELTNPLGRCDNLPRSRGLSEPSGTRTRTSHIFVSMSRENDPIAEAFENMSPEDRERFLTLLAQSFGSDEEEQEENEEPGSLVEVSLSEEEMRLSKNMPSGVSAWCRLYFTKSFPSVFTAIYSSSPHRRRCPLSRFAPWG